MIELFAGSPGGSQGCLVGYMVVDWVRLVRWVARYFWWVIGWVTAWLGESHGG